MVVMGDSMADWLASGLDQTYADTPEMAIARKNRTYSGLIYNAGRHDPRNSVDWPVAAREMLANEPAEFIVMMIGLSDRDPIRVAAVPPRPHTGRPKPDQPSGGQPGQPDAKPGQPGPAKPGQPDAGQQADQAKPADTPDNPDAAVHRPPGTPAATYEFKSEKWAELYGKRIDDTIAALKSKGVPVFWVGLPPLLGARSTADMQYLNDLFRSHAEKAGITYIDVWDGFTDDAGRFTMQGPDYEGQIRRLRTPDGVYFTPAGARKLAHYVEREIQRAHADRADRRPAAVGAAAGRSGGLEGTGRWDTTPARGPGSAVERQRRYVEVRSVAGWQRAATEHHRRRRDARARQG